MDLDAYRATYEIGAWRDHAAINGHCSAPFGAVLAVNALCDEVERLTAQLAIAHKETDSVAYARDQAYAELTRCRKVMAIAADVLSDEKYIPRYSQVEEALDALRELLDGSL